MFKIPSDKLNYSQTNESDRTGNVFRTKNIFFDKKGYIRVSERTRVLADSDTMTDISASTQPLVCIVVHSGYTERVFLLGNKNIYYSGEMPNSFDTFTKDAVSGVPTLDSGGDNDALFWNDFLYVVNNSSTIYKRTDSAWTTVSTYGGTCLCVFENRTELAIGDGSLVRLINTSDALSSTLTLPSNYKVTSMAWNNNRLYVATTNSDQGDTLLFEWDGASSEANTAYPISGHSIFSIVRYKNGVAFITSNGELLFCLGGLTQLATLPITFMEELWRDNNTGSNVSGRVYNRGMICEKDNIFIALTYRFSLENDNNRENRLSDFPGGVWMYDPKIGLYHRWSIDSSAILKTSAIATTDVNTTTNVITVGGVTIPATGTPCFYYDSDATTITGIKNAIRYFTIKLSGTTISLATTYANALAGTAIDITGTGNNAQFIRFMPNTGFGGINETASCLCNLSTRSQSTLESKTVATRFLIGGRVQKGTSATSATTVLCAVENYQENRGSITTPILESQKLEDVFQTIATKYKKLINADDKIVVKYRNVDSEIAPIATENEVAATWTDADTFTTTANLGAVVLGDEIEISGGSGAGYLVHVSSISEAGGTYTVNIDEAIQNITANDRMVFFASNWKKLGVVTTDDNKLDKSFRADSTSTWVQVKIEIRGVDTTMEEISVSNEDSKNQ